MQVYDQGTWSTTDFVFWTLRHRAWQWQVDLELYNLPCFCAVVEAVARPCMLVHTHSATGLVTCASQRRWRLKEKLQGPRKLEQKRRTGKEMPPQDTPPTPAPTQKEGGGRDGVTAQHMWGGEEGSTKLPSNGLYCSEVRQVGKFWIYLSL